MTTHIKSENKPGVDGVPLTLLIPALMRQRQAISVSSESIEFQDSQSYAEKSCLERERTC